jgi:hypothetical protein
MGCTCTYILGLFSPHTLCSYTSTGNLLHALPPPIPSSYLSRIFPPEIWLHIFQMIVFTMNGSIYELMLVNKYWHDIITGSPFFWSDFVLMGRQTRLPPHFRHLAKLPRITSMESWNVLSPRIPNLPLRLTILVDFGRFIGRPHVAFFDLITTVLAFSVNRLEKLALHIVHDHSNTPQRHHQTPMEEQILWRPGNQSCAYCVQRKRVGDNLRSVLDSFQPMVIKEFIFQDPHSLYPRFYDLALHTATGIRHLELYPPKEIDLGILHTLPLLESCIVNTIYLRDYTKTLDFPHLRTLIVTYASFAAISLIRAPLLERLFVDQEQANWSPLHTHVVSFPSLCSFRVSFLSGWFVPHFPKLQNLHLGLHCVADTWLLDLFSHSAPTRLSLSISTLEHVGILQRVLPQLHSVHTLQIEREPLHSGEWSVGKYALPDLVTSSANLHTTLRCLDFAGLAHGRKLTTKVTEIQTACIHLKGFVYHDETGNRYPIRDCDGVDCCRLLQEEFDDPGHAFRTTPHDKYCLTL